MIADLRFEGLSLTVADVERSVNFYAGVLGLDMVHAAIPAFALLRGGPVSLALLSLEAAAADGVTWGSPEQRRGVHVEFTTDDLDGLYALLRGKEVTILAPPHDEPWERAMSVADPDGHCVEFAEGRRGDRLQRTAN